MANRFMKMHSTSLIIRERRDPHTPVRMAVMEKTRHSTMLGGRGEIRKCCWWECKWVQPQWKILGRFLKKLKIKLPCDPAILLLGIYPKTVKPLTQRYLHPHDHCRKKKCPSFKNNVLLRKSRQL